MRKLLSIFIFSSFLFSCTDKNFDSVAWKNWRHQENTINLKWDMSNDLINNHNLIGMSKDNLFNLIGNPSQGGLKSNCWVTYSLGPCRTGISYGTLYITIKDNKVVKVSRNCG